MPARAPLIGVVDSGGPADQMQDARAFHANGESPPGVDQLGHGSAVARLVIRAAPDARLRHAQVFDHRPVTSADRVARAVDWLAEECDLILLSLGLAADRAVLAAACARAIQKRRILIAASPARGAPCWPAAYPGVIAATGDARCAWDGVSLLPGNIIGAWCASPEQGGAGMGGASLAAARVAGHLAANLSEARPDPASWLARQARYLGPERRQAVAATT